MKQIPKGHKVRTGAQGDDKRCQRASEAHTHSKRQQQQQQLTTVDEILPVCLPDTHLALDSDSDRLDWYGERVGGKAASERG
ncbi:hypothetical protein Pcinc_028544 [Petrolisthes cinctipes]|uniref:Uncharacterized protein n=1 Tax=Petrolisthes cinctipes TaxID=88211 RepID=A0AAE1F3E3_PETCI|nr:hypothetical protein Pcinc_028544 [Petrolisthes cinctipes]